MPSYSSLGGPLVFIGASILRLQDFSTLELPQNTKSIVISVVIKFAILVLFSVALIVLIVVNLMRIGFLWMVIALSPLLVIAKFLGQEL